MLIAILSFYTAILTEACNVNECEAVVYQDCSNSEHCGSDCEYLADGIGTSGCAWNACTAVTGTGAWQDICGGIDAIDVSGGCSFQLAKNSNGVNPYGTMYLPGFHGIWMVLFCIHLFSIFVE